MPKLSGDCVYECSLFVAGGLGLVAVSYFFADRQLAEALRSHLPNVKSFMVWLTYLAAPLTPVSAAFVFAMAMRRLLLGVPTPLEVSLFRGACAVLISGALTFGLKEVLGRTWPETWVNNNPSYFGNGVYGFFPFHGGREFASFPSAHMTVMGALAGTIWFLWPKMAWLGIALATAVAVGLLGADFHWLSDILAGSLIGLATACIAFRIGS